MGLRNFCINCQVELRSAEASGDLDWGCMCSDAAGNEYRCCEKCHNKHHNEKTMHIFDNDTYDDE